jgi:mono/diheme cytochrome c family protein
MQRLFVLALIVPAVAAGCGGSGSTVSDGPGNPVPRWVVNEHLPARAVPGALLFKVMGCTACHTYMGTGSQVLNAPDLTAEGARNASVRFQIRHLQCPSCVPPGSPMPAFAQLGSKRLQQLAIFLVASKGTR